MNVNTLFVSWDMDAKGIMSALICRLPAACHVGDKMLRFHDDEPAKSLWIQTNKGRNSLGNYDLYRLVSAAMISRAC